MEMVTLSTKGQLVIPTRFREALHLRAGDRLSVRVEGEQLIVQREPSARARLVEKRGRKVLMAPAGAPVMNDKTVKAVLADFP